MFFHCRNRVFCGGCHLGGGLYSHLNDNSSISNPLSQGGPHATLNSANSPQNGALNLDPKTDETIYTTDNGIEIKSHNVSATGTATSIQYFTLGSYNGTAVNWLIVGASSSGIAPDSTPAGSAIIADQSKQKLVTGVTSTTLATNQILCISQYAFNQATFNPNYTAHASVTVNFTSGVKNYALFSSTTDGFSDYYASYTALPNHVSNALTLGTTLGVNGYYGSGSGKIVKNSTFSSNYVFSLSSSHYTTFVGATNYKVPYLFTATSTATNIYANNTAVAGNVTSTCSYRDHGDSSFLYKVSGSGAANAQLTNYINTSAAVSNFTLANFTGTSTSSSNRVKVGSGTSNGSSVSVYCYHFSTSYSVSGNNSLSLAYRPAFIMQL